MIFSKFFKHDEKVEDTPKTEVKKSSIFQRVKRVYCFGDLNLCHAGFSFWHSEYTSDPKVISKIFEYLRTASEIRLYVTRDFIEYSAMTSKHGQVNGGCHRGQYMFFEFGIRRSGHRFDIYGEDRTDPEIAAFYEWWKNLVHPYEIEFDNDYNL